MPDPTPIRGPAPVSNLRPIRDPRIGVDGMVEAIDAIRDDLPVGVSELRFEIMVAVHRLGSGATLPALQMATGLKREVLLEHIKAMRFKGLLMFEGCKLTPRAARLVKNGTLGVLQDLHPPSKLKGGAKPLPPALPRLNKTDRFAEALSEGLSVAEAGESVGWPLTTARVMLCRLQKRLGSQAV